MEQYGQMGGSSFLSILELFCRSLSVGVSLPESLFTPSTGRIATGHPSSSSLQPSMAREQPTVTSCVHVQQLHVPANHSKSTWAKRQPLPYSPLRLRQLPYKLAESQQLQLSSLAERWGSREALGVAQVLLRRARHRSRSARRSACCRRLCKCNAVQRSSSRHNRSSQNQDEPNCSGFAELQLQ
jgi:hypothetical protein